MIVNRGTAGAAEIAAAALLDSKRAQLVGERTYGDASIRKAITMEDGSAVILSVAKYYSPSGISIQDKGVTPGTIQAEAEAAATEDDDDSDTPSASAAAPGVPNKVGDSVLMKAYEIFKK